MLTFGPADTTVFNGCYSTGQLDMNPEKNVAWMYRTEFYVYIPEIQILRHSFQK